MNLNCPVHSCVFIITNLPVVQFKLGGEVLNEKENHTCTLPENQTEAEFFPSKRWTVRSGCEFIFSSETDFTAYNVWLGEIQYTRLID